jgi:hypothetical protein
LHEFCKKFLEGRKKFLWGVQKIFALPWENILGVYARAGIYTRDLSRFGWVVAGGRRA